MSAPLDLDAIEDRLEAGYLDDSRALIAEVRRLREAPGRTTKDAILNVLGDAADSLESRAKLREAQETIARLREDGERVRRAMETIEEACDRINAGGPGRAEADQDHEDGWTDLRAAVEALGGSK